MSHAQAREKEEVKDPVRIADVACAMWQNDGELNDLVIIAKCHMSIGKKIS